MADSEQAAAATSTTDRDPTPPLQIFLISYPKVVFLYPSLVAAIIAGIYMSVTKEQPGEGASGFVGGVFLLILGVNLVVLSFDFPRGTSLTLFFLIAALVLGALLLLRLNPNIFRPIYNLLRSIEPWGNASFYFTFAGIISLIYVAVLISVRFDYWEVRPNELLHHHGILSDLERFSAPNMRIDKEINDIFEYCLLRSGRLIVHPSNERRAIVLENILSINHKEREITKMLGALQVRVRSEDS